MIRLALRCAHLVWGLPQNLVGSIVWLVFHRSAHRTFHACCVTEWDLSRGLSLGLFVFVPKGCPRRLLVHEYGHAVQSLLLGPLYLPVIVLPSLVWAGMPMLSRWRHRHRVSYYAFYPERWANRLGERACHEPAMGLEMVD